MWQRTTLSLLLLGSLALPAVAAGPEQSLRLHFGSFRPDGEFRQCNVWCAMFAEQALSWYARWRAGEALGVTAADIV